MSPDIPLTLGVLLTWIGLGLILRSVVLLASMRRSSSGGLPRAAWTGVSALAALAVGGKLTESLRTSPSTGGISLPLVWWVMPFSAWLAAGSTALAVVFLFQARAELNRAERLAKLKAAIGCAVVAVVGLVLYRLDPENKLSMFKGAIPIGFTTALTLLALALAAIGVPAFLAKSPRWRGVSKGVATHLALIAGSILFGIPLLYLLITSFKEDRDMSSLNGIIWVPRVQRTMPYFDPKNPLYETDYQGQKVEASLTHERYGTIYLDIEKPLALRGVEVVTTADQLKLIPRDAPLVQATMEGHRVTGLVVENLEDGAQRVRVLEPHELAGREAVYTPSQLEPVRDVGLRWQNYTEALSYMPPETASGLVFLKNTLLIAVLSVLGTVLSSALAAYAFARMRFPGRDAIFAIFLSTMMLPAAVTMLPQFLIFRQLGWIDTLLPLWAPAFFGSAFNIFMLRQFFRTIPMELEDAAKIDGCSYSRTFWSVMLPQIKPALAVIGIWTFMGAWNNFMGPLIYINSPQKMPISYALQLFMGDRGSEPGLLMAFVTLTVIPVLLLFFFAQRYFIEGVTLSGLGGK